MKNRFRVEVYDANKLNDLTIYSEQGIDKDYLTEIVFSNLSRFSGNVKAYVYDEIKKKKTVALFLPEQTVNKYKPKQLTRIELGLI
jgi:tellurite resistance-related uncharacterized protein